MYLGDLIEDGTHDFKFSTFDQTGAGATLSGTPVISAYKNNSTTQSTAGITLTADFDSVTGLNHVRLVLTDTFYEADTDYDLVITTGTVDGVSVVGRKIATFSIANRVMRGTDDAALATALATVDTNVDAILVDTMTTLQAELDGIQADTEDIQSRLPAALVGGRMDSNAGAISGDATAADNLEAMFDGTGYTDDSGPASRSQVNNIGSASGGAFNFSAETDNTGGAIKSITFVGSQTNTFAATESEDATNHTIDDTGNAFDIVYQYDIGGGRTGVEVTFHGYLNGSNDSCDIQAYDFVGADWETVKTLSGQSGTTNITEVIPLLTKHTGTGSDLGNVLIRFVTTGQSNPQLNIDQLLVAGVNTGQTVGYANGQIWIDTNDGTAGTEAFVNGTADNPVNSLADAITISGNIGLKSFNIATGSSITLAASAEDYEFEGNGWTLALGGQSIAGTFVMGATISGTFTGSTGIFEDCIINAITGPGLTMRRCFFNDVTITNNGTDGWYLNDCRSRVAGTASPNFDFGAAAGNTGLSLRAYSGGLELENMGQSGTDNASIEGFGALTVNANCTGGTIALRGLFRLTDNGSATIVKDDVETSVDAILVDTNELQSDDIPGAIAGLNDPTAASVADAVWDEAQADHVIAGSFGELAPALALVLADTNELQTDDVPGLIAALNDLAAADVLTQVNAALDTAISELGVGVPTATPTLRTGLMLLYMALRNKLDVQTSGTDALEIHNNAGTLITQKLLTDDGSDYSEAKMT